MREILFKAKRVDNGEWVVGSLITGVFFRLGKDIPYIFCPEEVDYDCFEDFTEGYGIHEVYIDTICQFTGLIDKNGKKIFEGDIMNNPGNVVEFCTDGFCINGDSPLVFWTKTEIIGNIHDNPKLLQEGV